MRMTALALLLAIPLMAADEPRRESTEWCDFWMPNTNARDLPRVLLIGDSITRGYFPEVERLLKSKAYVARIATSKAIGDPALLAEIAVFIGQAKFEVVHFNIGMHGWAYSESEYRDHFPALVNAIRKGAPGARLIWASTTPIRKNRENGPDNGRIEARNAIAREINQNAGIPVNDLHGLMLPHTDLHSDDIHFNKEGSALMAAQVAASVEKSLPAR